MAVLIASPQAIIKEGASLAITLSLTLDARDIFEKGLAMLTSHQRRDAGVGLGDAGQVQPSSFLRDLRVVHAVGQGGDEFIEDMNNLRTARLQVLNNLRSGNQTIAFLLQVFDLFDFLVERINLGIDKAQAERLNNRHFTNTFSACAFM